MLLGFCCVSGDSAFYIFIQFSKFNIPLVDNIQDGSKGNPHYTKLPINRIELSLTHATRGRGNLPQHGFCKIPPCYQRNLTFVFGTLSLVSWTGSCLTMVLILYQRKNAVRSVWSWQISPTLFSEWSATRVSPRTDPFPPTHGGSHTVD